MATHSHRYRPDNVSMAKFLLSSRVGDVAHKAGEDIADAAREDAAQHSRTGTLAAGYDAIPSVGGEKMEGGPRKTAVVFNNVRHAALIELGGPRNPARHHLLKAGLKYHTPRVKL
jgi:Bacteriophage HK97-gp10, putative tail-component